MFRVISLIVCLVLPANVLAQSAVAQFENVSKTNPATSVNGLFVGRAGTDGGSVTSEAPNGFAVQEVETRFSANVDPYFRGDFTLALHREPGEIRYAIEPEEAFVETLSLPSVTLRAGKFLAFFGRHNTFHTHSFPFVDMPLANQRILGEDGLSEPGVAASYLVPTPWYLEIVAQVFKGVTDNLFNSSDQGAVAGILFIKQVWDLSDSSTAEWSVSAGAGANEFRKTTQLYDTALTLRYRPVEKSAYHSIIWTTEYLSGFREGARTDVNQGGVATWLQYQFLKAFWVQGRAEYLGLPKPSGGDIGKGSLLLGYIPTEYSALRLQYDAIHDASKADLEHRVTLQLNVSIGAHPAHSY